MIHDHYSFFLFYLLKYKNILSLHNDTIFVAKKCQILSKIIAISQIIYLAAEMCIGTGMIYVLSAYQNKKHSEAF